MSYRSEVIADSTGNWNSNGLRFATRGEAEHYVSDLFSRWTSVRETRVVVDANSENAKWIAGRVIHLKDLEHDLQVNAVLDNKDGLTP